MTVSLQQLRPAVANIGTAVAPAPRGQPAVLLSMAHWYGTLAAVRELGRRGVAVHVGSSSPIRQAFWSRYADRRVTCPGERDSRRYLSWLLEYGRRNRGTVLLSTSDDICFLHAAHEGELRKSFVFVTPGLAVLRELLDKRRLYQHAEHVGLRTPATLFPEDGSEALALAAGSRWPQLLKQRTQVFSRTLHKGTPVKSGDTLRRAYEAFRAHNRFDPDVVERWPDVDRPMLQDYLPLSSGRIYCISGFLAPGGRKWATRAALKVLSHPRYLGVGLLLEQAEVVPELEQRLIRLCNGIGYHGVFQCEFLVHEGQHLLIDFNPRFYNYMALDHARGLPQAYLDYLRATGAHEELDAEIERARSPGVDASRTVYCYRLGTWTQLRLERLFGRISRDEPARWRRWRSGASTAVDPVWARDDLLPGFADLLVNLWNLVRHPRSFLRGNMRRPL